MPEIASPNSNTTRDGTDHAVEVVCDESFPTREEAVETIVDRLEDCVDPDELGTERTQ
jgi:hypothetical protein